MKLVAYAQGSQAWVDWRSAGIGASESAAITGRSTYQTCLQLWRLKTGLDAPVAENHFMRHGKKYEDKARQAAEAHLGEILLTSCAEHDQHSWLRASFDGLTAAGEPVELKCPAESTFEDVLVRGVNSDAYRLYWCQVQHQMAVAGAGRGWLFFYDVKGNRMIPFLIERDQAYIDQLLIEGERFMQLLASNTPPAADPERDTLYPDDAKWAQAHLRYVEAKRQQAAAAEKVKVAEAAIKEVEKEILDMMGPFKTASFKGLGVTRYEQQGLVDNKSYIAKLQALLSEAKIDFPPDADFRKEGSERTRFTVDEAAVAANAKAALKLVVGGDVCMP